MEPIKTKRKHNNHITLTTKKTTKTLGEKDLPHPNWIFEF